MLQLLAALGRWFAMGWKAFGYWRDARAAGDAEEATGWLVEWVLRVALGLGFAVVVCVAIWLDWLLTG